MARALVLGSLIVALPLAVACKRSPAEAGAEEEGPAARAELDLAVKRAACLAPSLSAPPGASGRDRWKEVAAVSAGGRQYGWILVEQSFADATRADAQSYPLVVAGGLGKAPGASAACEEVPGGWEAARAGTVVTAIVRVKGTEASGQYVVLGAKADATDLVPHSKLLDGQSVEAARHEALALLASELGEVPSPRRAPAAWAAAAAAPAK